MPFLMSNMQKWFPFRKNCDIHITFKVKHDANSKMCPYICSANKEREDWL